jgi:alpha-glucosidase
MNEPSNFPCNFPCNNPYASAVDFPPELPPARTPPRPLPGFPCAFQPADTPCEDANMKREIEAPVVPEVRDVQTRPGPGKELGLPGRDLLYPKYGIHNAAAFTVDYNDAEGGISNKTVNTDIMHQNGLTSKLSYYLEPLNCHGWSSGSIWSSSWTYF